MQISDDGDLVVVHGIRRDQQVEINLGPATTKRFEDLEEFLQRLKIHAIDKDF